MTHRYVLPSSHPAAFRSGSSARLMYMKDEASDAEFSLHQGRNYNALPRSTRRPTRPPTSIALDDNFDAITTEVPTEWNVPYRELEYEESISGYQNYVNEIERKMSNEDEFHRQEISERKPAPPLPSARSNGYIYRNGSEAGSRRAGEEAGRAWVKVVHDGPERTISLWRERDAPSQSLRRVVSDGPTGNGSTKGAHVGEPHMHKTAKATYERSEYMVAYRPNPKDGYLMPVLSRSESISTIPFATMGMDPRPFNPEAMPNSPTSPTSPTKKHTHGRSSLDRSEFVMTYPQTPPHSGSTVSSPGPHVPKPSHHQSSSLNHQMPGSMTTMAPPTDGTKATSTSPVELILASCEPSLLHIAPILSELGMQRMEHLRAIARLTEDTRNREVKEYALKRGVTVVEWAILLDKLRAL
ncbi:uncharacterized protein B0H18DRAFT_973904 [Fomitopsis serialis]|uniref:uncharacterized protein n=1 Tax=Fomitopsis serialis TaxID=139415 RepID=UPI002008E047|nr:uncharacterized protein B0H18DRAFT_973904 [Neoantrodia serialis]KAH9936428.1 hypothetical protein B0H18DRAFT_973904 [Neoantrodia serialis]